MPSPVQERRKQRHNHCFEGASTSLLSVCTDSQARFHISWRARDTLPGEGSLLAREMRESFTEQVASELDRNPRWGNLCEQRTRGVRAQEVPWERPVRHLGMRTRREERKWAGDVAGARWLKA